MKRYSQDPKWITTRYHSKCDTCGVDIPKGATAFYYPLNKSMHCEQECGHECAREFESARFDEDMWS